jgi:23S rRNA (cytosine1962-C5)-methyltransferase
MVIDVYEKVAVLRFDGDAAAAFWLSQDLISALRKAMPTIDSIFFKVSRSRNDKQRSKAVVPKKSTPAASSSSASSSSSTSSSELSFTKSGNVPTTSTVMWGADYASKQPVSFLENGIKFTADLMHGQKTGFFVDQRDNRETLRRLVKLSHSRSVLNLFSYTGAFSVYAGLGGAQHVTSVDISAGALQAAKHHWELNGLDASKHRTVESDVFTYLQETGSRQRYDVVVVDPPSMAQSESNVPQATAAYKRLIRASASLLESNGLLLLSSCSSHITMPMLIEMAHESVDSTRMVGKSFVTCIHQAHNPLDHPTPIACPDMQYLKFLVYRLH